jgi:endonuclease III
MEVPPAEVAHAIRSGGLANQKSVRIQGIFREIERREGSVSLERFHDMSDEEIEAYLVSLPGVGTKTASCVLAFALGRPSFPVDTHVHRIVRRLGWVDPKAGADRTYRELNPVIPPEIRYELHRRFIRHGRETCKAQMPFCSACPVFDLCAAGSVLLGDGSAR